MGRSPRVLLVDDNNVNLRLLNAFMRKRGYTDIYLASDGAASVSIYNKLIAQTPPAPPDIIFMDISMPIMNGFEATRRILASQAGAGCRIIILTTFDLDQYVSPPSPSAPAGSC